MRKSIVMMIVLLGFVVAILTLPGWKEADERGSGDNVRTATVSKLASADMDDDNGEGEAARDMGSAAQLQLAAPEKQDEQAGEILPPEQLSIALAEMEDGFGLRFGTGQYVTLLGTVQAGNAIVHMTERSSKAGDSRIYDAVVVRPETGEAETYPLFETLGDSYDYKGSPQLYPSGNNQVWFLKHSLDNEQLSYSLMSLDVSTGGLSTLVPDFWLVDQRDEAERDDFIMQGYPLYDEQGLLQKLMVTTFRGEMWVLPWEGGYSPAVYDSPATYPAFGDSGSQPPRSLLFPSPDLGRFVYRFVDRNQIMPGNHYGVIDTGTREVVGVISMEGTMMPMDNGIQWNEDGSLFFLEYAPRDDTMGMSWDNAHYVFAQGIDVYNRDGKLVRSLKAPSAKRINAYGWVDENYLLLEVYTPRQQQEDGTWWKEKVGYQLYDVESGQAEGLKIVPDVREMNEAVQKLDGFGHDSQSFLLLDRSAGQVWEPGVKGYQWHAHENILNVYMDEGALLYRWDEENKTLEPAYFDKEYALQAVAGEWGVFWHRSADNEGPTIQYIQLKQEETVRRQDALPQLPSSFFYEEPHKWWDAADREVRKLEEKQLRVKGSSRYGSLLLTALPGEMGSRNGVIHNAYGSYEVSFRDRNGRNTVLTRLDGIELEQDGEVGEMRSFSFRDYDVLFFQAKQFSYSTGFSGSGSPLYAYAVTKSGEAFPLSFRYALPSGEADGERISIVQHAPFVRQGDAVVMQSILDYEEGRYVLEWVPDMEERSLKLIGTKSKAVEDAALSPLMMNYSLHLAQALRMTDNAFPDDGPMNEERLRELFMDRAWRNPGFQTLRKAGAQFEEAGNPWRAFPWPAIGAELMRPDTIKVTFTFNLIYAIGKAAHLEGTLKQIDGQWRFYDFGTLKTEDWQRDVIMPELNGLLIEDKLEL